MQLDLADDSTRSSKICKVCGEPIPSVAIKCKTCDSYQDFRRYVSFSSTILALLTALFAVAGTNASNLYNLFVRPDSNLAVSFQSFDQDAIVVSASNSGTRPGTVGEALLSLRGRERQGPETTITLTYDGRRDELIVDPGKSRLLRFKLDPPDRAAELDRVNIVDYTCDLAVRTIQFSGKKNFEGYGDGGHRHPVKCGNAVRALHAKYFYHQD